MNEILIGIVPAILAFAAAIWKSKSDLDKQKLVNEAEIAKIKVEAAREREQDRERFEDRLKEMKAETDEELRKADAQVERNFLDNFTNPVTLLEQMEGLSKGLEAMPMLQEQMDALEKAKQTQQSQKGWKRN